MKDLVPRVRRLLVIGWRGTDTPFLELLRDDGLQAIRCMVVAGDGQSAEKVITNLRPFLDQAEFSVTDGGFTDFILRREGEAFFRG